MGEPLTVGRVVPANTGQPAVFNVTPRLTEIQQLIAEVQALSARIEALEQRLAVR